MKKNHLNRLFALLLLVLCVVGGNSILAQTFTYENLNYEVNSDGTTVTLTGHIDGIAATGEIHIPEIHL